MRRLLTVLVSAALAVALAGCGAATTDYPAPVASALQQQVLAATTAAADGDYETALVRLDELEVSVADAFARGSISQARADSINSAIELLRADLEALLEAPGNSDKPKPDKPGKPDKD